MRIKTRVRKPEEICNLEEVEDVLHRMDLLRNGNKPEDMVVAEIVQRGLGGAYMIETQVYAKRLMGQVDDWKIGEASQYCHQFYPHSYFVELRQRLQAEQHPRDSKSYVAK